MVAVTDPDALANDIVATVTADDAEAVITVATTTGLVVAGNGTDVLSLTGSQFDITASLASLTVASNNVGDTTVTVAANDQGNTDGAALADSAHIVITVTDTTPPTLTVPSGGITDTTDPGQPGGVVIFAVTASDPGSAPLPPVLVEAEPAPTVVCDPASGSFFPTGDSTVACTATDSSDNSSVESFLVTMVDDESPVIVGATNQTFTLPAVSSGPVTYTSPTSTDNSGSSTLTCTPTSGSTMSVGPNQVSCTATDRSGNVANANFVVTVNATQLPATGNSLSVLPNALALFSIGLFLVGATSVSRRFGTRR